jgi:hypothetical protein
MITRKLSIVLCVAVFAVAFGASAQARVVRRANQPAPQSPPASAPAVATPAVAAPAVVAVPAACAPVICCPRDICYRSHKGCGCYDPCKKMELILQVKDPCACCLVEVPVCIPACCTTAPRVCCYKGFLRREVVEYSWDCGFCLKVVFDRCGDVTVHYYGV